ncbi:MAG: PLP-dependent aspartate aminotransferase family protein [Bacteroidia bacterium]|nr:PLP-dependent aspartate aminotransferase family protein [Bacteroidia bacterium]
MDNKTKAIDTPFRHADAYGALSMPVYHTCAFEFETAQQMSDVFAGRIPEPDYSRTMNPTVTFFEDKVAAITGAESVIAFNSGMAAISNTLLATAISGQNIVASRHLFGNTYSLLAKSFARLGIEVRFVDLTDIEVTAKAIDENTACIYLEIVTNPQLEVADLKALSQLAHSRNVPLIADSTIIPFTEFSGKELGLDIEVVSSTKYLSGGATSLGGLSIHYGRYPEIAKRIQTDMLFNFGAYMTPHAAYMQSIGLETLHARYKVQSANALAVATALEKREKICKVGYVGLESNKYHELAQKQFGKTAGAMVTFDLQSQEECYRFIDNLQLIRRATNLFDNRTLAIHPYSTIFVGFSAEEKAEMDVLPTTIRLSVGLEEVSDILSDIDQALEKL